MPRNNHYLIISQSGRALAASARRAGINPHVIDLFADEDTIENTASCHSVTDFSGGNNPQLLIDGIATYVEKFEAIEIVIGSGFEDIPDLLADLETRFSVIANDADVVRQVKDPAIFFGKLDQLTLPYPEYFSEIPDAGLPAGRFLKKAIGGAGGGHVSFYEQDKAMDTVPGSGCYLQALVGGKNYSVTFIADGKSFHVLGFNETWHGKNDFKFAVAVSNADLANACRSQVTAAIRKLVVEFNLRGLCSLDFIVDASGHYSILEINPRPPASFELYEHQNGLFALHLAAFNGKLTKPALLKTESSALGVLYAGESITIPRLEWPSWVTDRPKSGKHIAPGEPICTVHAEADNAENARKLLMIRLTEHRRTLGLSLAAA